MSGDMIGQMYPPIDTTYPHANSTVNTRNTRYHREDTKSQQSRRNLDHKETAENTVVVDKLMETIKEKDLEIERLQRINRKITKQKEETEKRSLQLTREMAKLTTVGGNFENLGDELSNSEITARFQKLYSYDWARLLRWLVKTFPDVSELKIIQCISKLLKFGYEECQIIADSQIRHFLLLDMTETVSSNEQHQELYLLRRKYSHRETTRTKIVQVVLERLLLVGSLSVFFKGERREDAKQKLHDFFNNYLDCCWLMVVSNPPITLNFNVIGEAYRKCMEQFTKYSPKSPVEDRTKIEDTIYEVVWPSVCLHVGSECYQKGDVVVVAKGKISDNSNCDCCTFNKYQKDVNPSTRRVREGRSGVHEGSTGVLEGRSGVRDGSTGVREGRSSVREGSTGVREGRSGKREGSTSVREGRSGVREGSTGVREGISGVREYSTGVREGRSGAKENVSSSNKTKSEEKHRTTKQSFV
ncbi:uncharacterized protein LOC123528451 [Mercenaria mercenaria]|uniref:uncharacterized protein LOC123528451 n=1 Tax=Mercenaria mercenaria TaxID=6596 RepID=UPI00234F8D12|nr:uncharacterized protein LOC123528451 [Mercenaria mercenaria]